MRHVTTKPVLRASVQVQRKQGCTHGVHCRMISVDNFFVFLRLLFFAVLLLYVT